MKPDFRKRLSLLHQPAVSHRMAEWTGLEPATPGVTGRYSNQLNYHSDETLALPVKPWWVLRGSNPRPSPCKGDALPTELSTRKRPQAAAPFADRPDDRQSGRPQPIPALADFARVYSKRSKRLSTTAPAAQRFPLTSRARRHDRDAAASPAARASDRRDSWDGFRPGGDRSPAARSVSAWSGRCDPRRRHPDRATPPAPAVPPARPRRRAAAPVRSPAPDRSTAPAGCRDCP